ncbi:MAG: TIGR04282 family arsenosugar biosynthesis glycosyltransferase [Sedimenticolaceae bacterium]
MNTPATRCLVVFARDPLPGRVKTRLIPAIGEGAATAIYRQMLQDTLATASQAAAERRELWIDTSHPGSTPVRLARGHGMSIHAQPGGDIGARMHSAFNETLARVRSVVLIGTDCPEYDAAYIDAAFQALEAHDAVLGPAADGGYVLIGLRRAEPAVFEGIPWGSGQVLAATRRRFAQLQWRWCELPVLHDVDEVDDLLKFPHLSEIAEASAQ